MQSSIMIKLGDKGLDVHEHSCRNFLINELSSPWCRALALWIGKRISKDRSLLLLFISRGEERKKWAPLLAGCESGADPGRKSDL